MSNFDQNLFLRSDNLARLRPSGVGDCTESSPMLTTEQYRTKAAEYSKLAKSANGEVTDFQNLERSFAELAENAQWVADHHDQTLRAPK
jgi:hypothetical protein